MGRRKLDWRELDARGCKRSRVLARKREQENTTPAMADYFAAARKEDSTFKKRIRAGESIMRQFKGDVFDWQTQHPLTQARDFCLTVSHDESYRCAETRRQCKEFIANLKDGARRDWFLDPEAAGNITRLISAFGEPGMILDGLTIFDLTEFLAAKKSDGSYILGDEELLGFPAPVIAMLDKAILAQRAAA
jgi:hypothetical protein